MALAPESANPPSPDDLSAGRSAGRGPGRLRRAASRLYCSHLIAGFSIAASNILLGLTVLLAPLLVRRRDLTRPDLRPLFLPVGIYALWLLGSIFASFEPATSLGGARELFTLSTLLLAPVLVRGERQVRWLVNALVISAAVLACAGLAQYLVGYGDIDRRIRGPFSHYMTFSGFLLLCDLLLLAGLPGSAKGAGRWRWAALAAINIALLGSLTRNAWVALAVALTVLLLVRAPRLLLWYAPALLFLLVLAPIPLLQRFTSIADLQDTSNYDRLCMLRAGFSMVAERPLFGLGPEMVERRYAIYRPPTAPRHDVPHLHNTFLQLAAERGLPSLLAYLALTFASVRLAYRRFRGEGGRRGPRADLYLGAMLALLAFNVAGLFENNWGDTEVQRPVLFLLALPFCLAAAAPEEAGGEEPAGS